MKKKQLKRLIRSLDRDNEYLRFIIQSLQDDCKDKANKATALQRTLDSRAAAETRLTDKIERLEGRFKRAQSEWADQIAINADLREYRERSKPYISPALLKRIGDDIIYRKASLKVAIRKISELDGSLLRTSDPVKVAYYSRIRTEVNARKEMLERPYTYNESDRGITLDPPVIDSDEKCIKHGGRYPSMHC